MLRFLLKSINNIRSSATTNADVNQYVQPPMVLYRSVPMSNVIPLSKWLGINSIAANRVDGIINLNKILRINVLPPPPQIRDIQRLSVKLEALTIACEKANNLKQRKRH